MARMDEMEGVMPAGDIPPEQESGNMAPEKVYAGKYKTPEELESAYKEAESKIGSQGSAVGELRKTNEALVAQMNAMKAEMNKPTKVEPQNDYEQQLANVMEQMEAGELSIEQAIKATNQLTAQQVTKDAVAKSQAYFQEQLKTQKAEAVQQEFMKNNPDFMRLQQEGTLEAIKKQNPMHDEFSAFYEWKAIQAESKFKTGLAQADEEAQAANKVLKKPGAAIRQTNNKPIRAEGDMKKAMLAALNGAQE